MIKKLSENILINLIKQDKVGFINFIVGKKDFNLKMKGPIERGITFELPRNSLVDACKYSIFDDLLIGNFMKTQLHNLSSLYDPVINFNNIVPKYGDNGLAYTKEELISYEKEYAKLWVLNIFRFICKSIKNYFKFFLKLYYTKFRKIIILDSKGFQFQLPRTALGLFLFDL